MIKKGLLLLLILILSGCVGTMRIADESTKGSTTATHTKSTIIKPKD